MSPTLQIRTKSRRPMPTRNLSRPLFSRPYMPNQILNLSHRPSQPLKIRHRFSRFLRTRSTNQSNPHTRIATLGLFRHFNKSRAPTIKDPVSAPIVSTRRVPINNRPRVALRRIHALISHPFMDDGYILKVILKHAPIHSRRQYLYQTS